MNMPPFKTQEEAKLAAAKESAELAEDLESIPFFGQNCDETLEGNDVCDGWDGNSRRCDCGNMRVGWVFSEDAQGVWSYYAASN